MNSHIVHSDAYWTDRAMMCLDMVGSKKESSYRWVIVVYKIGFRWLVYHKYDTLFLDMANLHPPVVGKSDSCKNGAGQIP